MNTSRTSAKSEELSSFSNLDPSTDRSAQYAQNDVPPSYANIYPIANTKTTFASPGESPPGDAQSIARSTSGDNDDSLLNQALEFTKHNPNQHSTHRRLPLPVVIPQVGSGLGMPFARGYSDYLMEQGISMNEFVEFIDNYNIISGGSPPFQILDLVGGVVGLIPMAHAQIISTAISAAGKLGQFAWSTGSKSRATKFVEGANRDFFNPRGVKVEVATSEAVRAKLGMHPSVPLVAPYEQSHDLSVHERRMASLQGFAAPVTFNVSPPNEQTSRLKKMAAAQQSRTLQKQEKKALKDRDKYAEKSKDADKKITEKGSKVDKEMFKLEKEQQKIGTKREKEMAKVQKEYEKDRLDKPGEVEKIEREKASEIKKIEKDYQKELRKLDAERAKLDKEYNKDARKETEDAKKDDKEVKASEKVLWMLVEDF